MKASRKRLKRLVTGFGIAVAAATFVLIPAGFFVLTYLEGRHELEFSARLKANRVAKYIYTNQELWQYQTVRIAELIEVPEADETGHRTSVFDASGNLVMKTGDTPAFPVAARSAPIVTSGAVV